MSMYDRGLLLTALHTVGVKHDGQHRDSGEPYRTHLISVDDILFQLPFPEHPPVTIHLAALLHDILEDCSSSNLAMLVDTFGARTAAIVLALTKTDKQLYFSRISEAVAHDLWEVIFVKLADRLHNLTTIDNLEIERIRRKVQETLTTLRSCADMCRPHIPKENLRAFDELYGSVFTLAEEKAALYLA
jgi:GTP pyrophosphokinase